MATYVKFSELTGADQRALITAANPSAAKTADHTVTDNDDDYFEFETGGTATTLTLPTLADNQGRHVMIIKSDDGAGVLTIDGEGAETINGDTTWALVSQYDFLHVWGGASSWIVLDFKSHYDSGWVNQTDLTDLTATITHNLGAQLEFLDCRIVFATASDGTGAEPPASTGEDWASASERIYGVHFQDNSRNANSVVLQTGLTGVLLLNATGNLVNADAAHDYYRVIITRVK